MVKAWSLARNHAVPILGRLSFTSDPETLRLTMRWLTKLLRPEPTVLLTLPPWDGQIVDVDRFWAEAWTELQARQQFLSEHFKLAASDWAVDQDAGLIRFERPDGQTLSAPVQIIGAWNPLNETFTWGWDHPSVKTRLRADAERTRWFGEKHGLKELTDLTVKASELEAWRLTAVARKVNGSAAVYRGPTDGPVVFMTLGEPK